MTAKEYLNQIRTISFDVQHNRLQLEELEVEIRGLRAIDYSGVKVQTSPHDTMTESIAKLVDLSLKVAKETAELQATKARIISEIRQLTDARYVNLLTRRYVDGMAWDDIADAMGYSRSAVCHMHGRALQAFAEVCTHLHTHE